MTINTIPREPQGAQGLRDLCVQEAREEVARLEAEERAEVLRRQEVERESLVRAVARAVNVIPDGVHLRRDTPPYYLTVVDGLTFGLVEGALFLFEDCIYCGSLFTVGGHICTRRDVGHILLRLEGTGQSCCPECVGSCTMEQSIPPVEAPVRRAPYHCEARR